MNYSAVPIKRAACIGGGVIGSGWIARLLWHGVDVAVCDQHEEAEVRCRAVLANADRALLQLHGKSPVAPGALRFTTKISEAVEDVDFVQESVPEEVVLKQKVLSEIDTYAPADALIGTSTSGLQPTMLQSVMRAPVRFVVAHPFNPVYLLPLVEICGGEDTGDETIARAKELFQALGMYPLHVRREIDGFIADRLLEALWREALWLVNDDIATVSEVDDAIRYGAGLRWAMMGSFMTYRIAGGTDGMRHFMSQFGPTLKWPWTKLMDVPDLTDELLDKIAEQSDLQAEGMDLRTLERQRDQGLVALLKALKPLNIGAGALLGDTHMVSRRSSNLDLYANRPLVLHNATVSSAWVDCNGRMMGYRYSQMFEEAEDALFDLIGMGAEALTTGKRFQMVESHLQYLEEARSGELLQVTTQILACDGKHIHAFHRLWRVDEEALLATAEQLYLYGDVNGDCAKVADDQILNTLNRIANAHTNISIPEAVGCVIAIPGPRPEAIQAFQSDNESQIPSPDFEIYSNQDQINAAVPCETGVQVTWQDGHVSRFHNLWLRDNCPCAECINQLTREQVFDISLIDEDISPESIDIDALGALTLVWPDNHVSRIHPGWLRAHCYSSLEERAPITVTWDQYFKPPRFDGEVILKHDGALKEWLQALDTHGLALLGNCPLAPGAVEWFADRIAFLRHTNFGRVFDVRSKPDADSNAYTALELPLHTDLPTRELQPGLQFLLCRVNEAVGGVSIMADGFAIADALRQEQPEFFETLITVPMEFRNRARTSDYRLRSPAIHVDEHGRVTEVRIGNFLRGPQRTNEEQMPKFYKAYRHLIGMIREERFQIRFRLNAREMASFNNRRILHARSAFNPNTGERHLQGCYVDTDEFKSRLAILTREAAKLH